MGEGAPQRCGTLRETNVRIPLKSRASDSVLWNFKLLAHHELAGFGGMGEGMSIQGTKDGRPDHRGWRMESAPKNFTGLDVTDPRNPKIVVQTELPEPFMRSIRWRLSATSWPWPIRPKRSGRSRLGSSCSTSRYRKIRSRSLTLISPVRIHAVRTSCGSPTAKYVHIASGAPDFEPTHPLDDQCYQIFDVRNPSKPVEAGRWWMPGTRKGDDVRAAGAPQGIRHGLSRP